jgi:hypothetical protein
MVMVTAYTMCSDPLPFIRAPFIIVNADLIPKDKSKCVSQLRQPFLTPALIQETLDARSEYSNSQDDGTAEHRINQYIVKQEIGRGSFGSVHLAVDQFGNEFVRTAQSDNLLTKTRRLLRNFPRQD